MIVQYKREEFTYEVFRNFLSTLDNAKQLSIVCNNKTTITIVLWKVSEAKITYEPIPTKNECLYVINPFNNEAIPVFTNDSIQENKLLVVDGLQNITHVIYLDGDSQLKELKDRVSRLEEGLEQCERNESSSCSKDENSSCSKDNILRPHICNDCEAPKSNNPLICSKCGKIAHSCIEKVLSALSAENKNKPLICVSCALPPMN